MFDKNGRTIEAGDVVEVRNAYFKTDNHLYFVDNVPGDPDWIGKDCSLLKISKTGKISSAKANRQFYPLSVTVTDSLKAWDARDWNEKNAEIEIIDNVNKGEIVAYFDNKLNTAIEARQHYQREYGADHNFTKLQNELVKHYQKVIDRLVA